jgi:hypothetical protein
MRIAQLKKGSILSETSFYVVESVENGKVHMKDDAGRDITIGQKYVEQVLASADIWETEEKKTMTELAELFIANPRVAITVAFMKKAVDKTKKAYEAEKLAKITEIQNARVADVPALLNNLIENPLSRTIPGDLRVMKGRHYGHVDELGRIQFIDMELPWTDGISRNRQVDPRTILYVVVNGVKYSLK